MPEGWSQTQVPYLEGSRYQTPKEFVLSENLHRRHLSASQRAAFAVDLLPELKEQAKERMRAGGGDKKSGAEIVSDPITDTGEAVQKAADLAKTNSAYVRSAEQIAREAPELMNDVQNGKLTIPAAKKKLAAKKSAAQGKSAKPSRRKKIAVGNPREAADLAYDSLRNDQLSLADVVHALTTIIKISKPAMTALTRAYSDSAGISTEFLNQSWGSCFASAVPTTADLLSLCSAKWSSFPALLCRLASPSLTGF
jgi:hypothetical protein